MQSAYKPYHNTETLLLNLTNYISNKIKNNRFVILILLDLTAAFDTINHQILFAKIIIQLIKSHLTERIINIRSNKLSKTFNCSQIGVPQGSVLGPLLFNIYISDIDSIMNCYNAKYHMYADDTQIYTSTTFNELPNTLKEINSITTKLENYFNYNYLKFNLQKTECINSKSHTQPPITHIKIANKDIPIKTTITTLGVIFESDLTFYKHISSITKQCNYKIFKIKQIKHLLNPTLLKILTSAYILSKLDYCNSLLINIPKIQEKQLNKIINHTCRFILQTYFLYTLSPIHFSHIHNVHCIPPSHAFPSHATSLHIYYHNYYLDYLFILKNILFTILILLYFVYNTYTHLRTM